MIEDSLGRTVDAGGMSLPDLKGMLSSLMSGKTTAQPLPESAKTPDKSAAAKETYNILKQINTNLSQNFSQQKALLDQVVNLVKNSGSGGENKSLGSSIEKFSLSFSEKSNALSGNLGTASQAMRTYGQNISKLDRTMSSMTSMLRIVMGAALKQMGGGGGAGVGFGKEATKELATLNKTEQASAALDKQHGGKLATMAEHGLKKGSIYTHDHKLAQLMLDMKKSQLDYSNSLKTAADKQALRDAKRDINTKVLQIQQEKLNDEIKKSNSGFGGKLGAVFSGIKAIGVVVGKAAGVAAKVTAAPSIKDTVMGGHEGSPAEAFAGMMNEQRKITIEARQIAYETAGITGATRELQKEYLVTEETSLRTGVHKVELQKRLSQFQRMGVKDQRLLKDITVATVAAEKQLGLEAGSLSDDFLKLHQEAGFTKGQINQTAKGMMDVARSSGLSGNELKKVMDSSKGILQNMKNATTLTADAIKNVNSVMAEAQKLGVTEQLSTLLSAASSSSNLFLKASTETKTLLFQAAQSVGRVADLQNGVILKSKTGMKELGVGMDNVLKRFGVDGVDAIDTLSDEAKRQLNLNLQTAYKMDLGEFMRSAKSLKDGARGYGERLQEIDEQLKKNGNTQLDIEAKKQAEIKKSALLQEASSGLVNVFEESLKGAGGGAAGMQKAMEKFNAALTKGDARSKDLQDSISALAAQKGMAGPLTGEQSLGLAMEVGMKGLNEKLAKVGLSEKALSPEMIAEAMQDKDKFQALQDTMQKLQQEADAKEKAMSDPSLQAEYELIKLNDEIAGYAQEAGNIAADALNYQGMIAASAAEYIVQSMIANDFLSNILQAILSLPTYLLSAVTGGLRGTGLATSMAGVLNAVTKRLPLIGGVVDFGRRLAAGEGVGKATAGGVGTFAGGIAGAKVGAAAGSFLIPILGPLGPALGGIVGSVIGMIAGSKFGALAYDYIIKPIMDGIISFGKGIGSFLYNYIWTPFVNFLSWLGSGLMTVLVDYIWKPFISFFGWLGSKIGTLFIDYIWKPYVSFWTWVGTSIMRLFMDYIWTPFVNFFSWLGGTALGGLFMEYIWTPFADFWMWVGTTIASMFVENIWNPIVGFFSWMGTAVGGLFMDYFWNPIVGFFSWVGSAVEGLFMDSFWNPIVSAFGWVIDKVTGLFTGMWDMVKNAFSGVAEWFGSWGSSIWNFLYKGASAVGLGWLLGEAKPAAATSATPAPATPATATAITQTATSKANPALQQAQQNAALMAQKSGMTQVQLQQRSMVMEAQKNIEQMRKTDPAKAVEMAKELQKDIERNAKSKSPGTTGPGPTMPGQATPVTPGGPAVSAAPSMSGPMVPPYQTMAATRTGTASVTMNPTVGGLGDLAKVGQSELEYAKQQVDLLSKILTSLSSGGGGGSATTAPAKTATGGTDNYFKLPTGNFNESSIREVTNL